MDLSLDGGQSASERADAIPPLRPREPPAVRHLSVETNVRHTTRNAEIQCTSLARAFTSDKSGLNAAP